MLLFNINRKAYLGSPFVHLHFTLVTLMGQSEGHSDFEALYLVKGQELGHMLVFNINRKVSLGNPIV